MMAIFGLVIAGAVAALFRPRRSRYLWVALLLPILALLFDSCARRTGDATLFTGDAAQDALKKITAKMNGPVRVLRIEIKPATLRMQVQDPAAQSQVNEYAYRKLTGL